MVPTTSQRRLPAALVVLLGWEALLASAAPLPPAVTVTLASHGEAKATVVIAPDASRGVQLAAAELSHYTARMAGCPSPLPIKALAEPPALASSDESFVFVGTVQWALSLTAFDAAQLPAEGYSIFAHNSSWLFVVGKNDTDLPDKGHLQLGGNGPVGANDTLAAVHGLLGHLGVAWIWPGQMGEVVPALPVVSVPPGGANISSAPPLIQRHLRPIYHSKGLPAWRFPSGNVAADTALTAWMNDSVYEQLSQEESQWLQRQRMGGHAVPPWGQAFMTWWAQYNHTHPEYFALQPDGHRGPVVSSEPDRVKMCVSNPALHRAIAAGGTDHNMYGLSAAEDDSNTGYCTCSKCTAWDAPAVIPWNQPGASATGSLSDRYAKFFDEVYTELAKTAPEAWVTAYAYEQYRDPPVNYTISGNVMMGYVGFGYPALQEELDQNQAHWAGWFSAGAKRLFWRPNCLIAGDGMP